jgi:hypothetical protein
MDDRPIRRGVWAGVLGSLALLGVVLFVLNRPASQPPQTPPVAETPQALPADNLPTRPDLSTGANRSALEDAEPPPFIEGELYGALDLGEVRAALPDNLYWEWGVPTKDPAELEKRDREKARRNEEYGRVLAGDANEAEVNAYYDYRERLSTDYLELADYIKRQFGEKLDERFNGLLDLAIRLNKARLAQIPSDREDALTRNRERAKIREEWQREQAEFEAARRNNAQE